MPSKRKLKYLIFTLVFFFSLLPPSYSTEVPEQPGNYVVDLAGIIDAVIEAKLNQYLRELEQKTTAQMAILTITSLEGQPIEEYSVTIAHDKWKLGQKGKDNGVLLVVALKDRKYRIEVGYGLEGVLPDSLVGSIGRNYIVPYFKKGDYSNGIYTATLAIAKGIADDAGVKISGMPFVKKTDQVKRKDKSSGFFGKIGSLIFFLIVVILFIRNPRLFFIFFLLSGMGGRRGAWGGSSGGFGGSGFGGFSGGGGGFGGGGASGSW